MRFSQLVGGFLLVAAAASVVIFPAATVEAKEATRITRIYKVQVEYWYWDSDYYTWKTVFETTDRDDADFMYTLLLAAKANGQLNSVAPHEYWMYFAVDVRMITVYKMPEFQFQYDDLILRDL